MDANYNGLINMLCRASRLSHAGAKRRSRLLAEFLQRRPDRQLGDAQGQTGQETEFQSFTTLEHDLLFKILISLNAESLLKPQLVCKRWFGLINSSLFVTCHSQQSETVLISQESALLEPSWNSASSSEQSMKSYFHFVDLDTGKDSFVKSRFNDLVEIRASCNGLILASLLKSENLILMNPVTRKHVTLPLGTRGNFTEGSYGIALCSKANTYKVVHLFREILGKVGCQILPITRTTRTWRKVEQHSPELVLGIMKFPISIKGSLYWMPNKHGCDNFVSMNMDDEKFVTKKLPAVCGVKDRILEIGGSLGFVTHAEVDVLHVWILIGENWIKRCNIALGAGFRYPIPICSSRNGRGIAFESPGHQLCVYDFDKGEMKGVCGRSRDAQSWNERIENAYIPHRNTLASWEPDLHQAQVL